MTIIKYRLIIIYNSPSKKKFNKKQDDIINLFKKLIRHAAKFHVKICFLSLYLRVIIFECFQIINRGDINKWSSQEITDTFLLVLDFD